MNAGTAAMRPKAATRAMGLKGLTLIEVMLSIFIILTAILSLSQVLAHDIRSTTDTRYDEIAHGAASRLIEFIARYEGFDRVNTMPSSTTNTGPTIPTELTTVPWIQGQAFVENFNGNPEVKLVTIVVRVAHAVDSTGQPISPRAWRIATLVAKRAFDKSGAAPPSNPQPVEW